MGHPQRYDAPDTVLHVYNRGAVRQTLFRDDADYRRFLALLGEAKQRFPFLLLAYCLMPNHYHLLARTVTAGLTAAMHWLQTTYAVYFKRRYDVSGHVFQGRFGSLPCSDDAHLWTLARYIHENPVRAGLCRSAEEWPYSSHRAYAQGLPDPLVDKGLILEAFPGEFRPTPPVLPTGPADREEVDIALWNILQRVAREHGQDTRIILGRSRLRTVSAARAAFIARAHEAGRSSHAIARFLGMSRQAVLYHLPRRPEKLDLLTP